MARLPDPHRREIRREENPYLRPVKREDELIPAPLWPVRKKEDVEVENA